MNKHNYHLKGIDKKAIKKARMKPLTGLMNGIELTKIWLDEPEELNCNTNQSSIKPLKKSS